MFLTYILILTLSQLNCGNIVLGPYLINSHDRVTVLTFFPPRRVTFLIQSLSWLKCSNMKSMEVNKCWSRELFQRLPCSSAISMILSTTDGLRLVKVTNMKENSVIQSSTTIVTYQLHLTAIAFLTPINDMYL